MLASETKPAAEKAGGEMAVMALGWGLVAGSAAIIGALLGWYGRLSHQTISLLLAFSCGILLSVAAFQLFDEAFARAGFVPAALGFVVGAAMFAAGLAWLDKRGAGHRRRTAVSQIAARDTASIVALGTVLDGIPRALIIGVSFYAGEGLGIATVVAVFLSSLPESLASTTRMRALGRSLAYVIGLWVAVALITGVAALAGYVLLGDLGPEGRAFLQAFTGGAFIVSIVDGLIPQVFSETRDMAGFVTAMGFLAGYALSHFVG